MLVQRVCAGCGSTSGSRRGQGRQRLSFCGSCAQRAEPVGQIFGLAGVDRGGAVFRYDGSARRAIVAAKSGARPDVLDYFGGRLADLIAETVQAASGTHLTWVPPSADGRRRRGYDQGRRLATVVGARLGLPVTRFLLRRRGVSQTGLTRTDRLSGPDLHVPVAVPAQIVLVDDVVTTGASLATAAAALRGAGALSVFGFAVAWTATPEEVAARRPSQHTPVTP